VTVRVLDATCGGRSIWIDKDHADAVYADLRIRDEGFCGHGGRTYSIQPDVQCDYRDLPFTADSFDAAVIDPPHATRGDGMEQLKGVVTKKYGALEAETWHDDLRSSARRRKRTTPRRGGSCSASPTPTPTNPAF